jgi:hypothetical protein
MQIHDTYFLVAIIDNDYVDSVLLFDVFDEILACDRELRAADADADTTTGLSSAGSKSVPLTADSPSEWF